ncbi:MAG: DUF2339 domain-containing protein [bacterium]
MGAMEAGLLVMMGLAGIGLFFVIPVILLVRLSAVLRELEALNLRFRSFEEAQKRACAARPVEEMKKAPLPSVAVSAPLAVHAAPAGTPPPVVAVPMLPGQTGTPVLRATGTPQKEPTPAERRMSQAWNWLVIGEEYRQPGVSWEYAVATNWLLRIGILAVLAGIAFFLKYSIEKGLMGPLGRVALSLAVGVGMICVGVRLLFKKYHLLGQGLVGTGFVTLYFAFYAASGMYHLMTQGAAFALMAVVTVAAGVLAVRYQSVMVAVLGLVGGYATPVMIGDSGTGALFFYAYVLLLGCGVLGVSLVRRWPVLNVLGMLASYALAFLYCERHHGQSQLMHDLLFLSAVHLLYLLSMILINIRTRLATTGVEWAAVFLNAGLYWVWVFILFKPVFGKEVPGLIALGVAAMYVAMVYACLQRKLADKGLLCLFIGLAAVFLAMSPVLMLSGEWLTLAWCLQALAMLWLAHQTGNDILGKLAVALFALACVRGMSWDLNRLYDTLRPASLSGLAFWKAAGLRALTYGVLPATLLAAWRLKRPGGKAAKVLGLVLVQVWLYASLEADVIARVYAPAFQHSAVTVVWTLFAFALLFAGIRVRGKWLRWCGLGLFAVAVGKLLVIDLAGLDTLYRIVAFISVGVLLVLGSFVYLKYKTLFEPEAGAQGKESGGRQHETE